MKLSHRACLLSPLFLPTAWSYASNPCASFFADRFHDPIKMIRHHPLSASISQTARCSETRLAMSSSPMSSSSPRTSPSPWSPGEWRITLDFGKEGSDSPSETSYDSTRLSNLLGEEWGADGGRLGLSFQVSANAETTTKRKNDNSVQMAWLGGKPTGTVECIPQSEDSDGDREYCASYVNTKGQQNVEISSGLWRLEPPLPLLPSYVNTLPGQAATLRFYLTLLTSIQRNSIRLPPNQLLLLQANSFRTRQYSDGIQTVLPYQYARDITQKRLEQQLDHDTGDRRLDGSDILETLGGYRDAAELVFERDERRRKWKEIEGALPKVDFSVDSDRRAAEINKLMEDERRWGAWPGDTELMTIERGVILAVIAKESKKNVGLFPWMQDGNGAEEPVIVGKWSAMPIFSDSYN